MREDGLSSTIYLEKVFQWHGELTRFDRLKAVEVVVWFELSWLIP